MQYALGFVHLVFKTDYYAITVNADGELMRVEEYEQEWSQGSPSLGAPRQSGSIFEKPSILEKNLELFKLLCPPDLVLPRPKQVNANIYSKLQKD